MPRVAKKGSTKDDILEQMFKELQNHPDSQYEEIGSKPITSYQQFSQINSANYNELIEHYINLRVAYDDTAPAHKDVHKIDFDFENYEVEENGNEQLPDGTAIIWAFAGGDWECPVWFVMYLDPTNKIRAYIPTDGNTFCKQCKCAIGTCACSNGPDEDEDPEEDLDLMYQDVCNRIQTK